MNRLTQYQQLLAELDPLPEQLDSTLERAIVRKGKKKRRALSVAAGLAASFALFVALVNFSAPVALACARLPILRELAAAVTFSRSLSDAVAHDYVQPMDLVQQDQGITARVEYLIVDQKQVNVFYRLESESYRHLTAYPEVPDPQDTLPPCMVYSSHSGAETGQLQQASIEFLEAGVPAQLALTLKVFDDAPAAQAQAPAPAAAESPAEPVWLAQFTFQLDFDPQFTAAGKVIPVNKALTLDGQSFTVTQIQIYPTHLRLDLAEDPDNTAWLVNLEFQIETGDGQIFTPVTNGVSAIGSPESPSMTSYRADSTYFYQAESLTLAVTGATWRHKVWDEISVDLKTGQTSPLPPGIRFLGANQQGTAWELSFQVEPPLGEGSAAAFSTQCLDPQGKLWQMTARSHRPLAEAADSGAFLEVLCLENYPYSQVCLIPWQTGTWNAPTPLRLPLPSANLAAGETR